MGTCEQLFIRLPYCVHIMCNVSHVDVDGN